MTATLQPYGSVILAPSGEPAWLQAVENNWYEASRWSPNRSFIWFPVQDAKKDLDRYTRSELSKHSRYLYKNSPLIRGLIERLVTLTVGSGFHPTFKSSSPEWNSRAKAFLTRKFRNVHLGSRCSMLQYQRAIARARFIDGECFTLKTADTTISFDERVQGLEADLVCGGKSKENGGAVDGFNLNSEGVVTSYNIVGVETPYAAEHVVHHFTPSRLGQYRGESILSAAINTARDVDDILALEKQCVKDASATKDVIKTATGTLDAESFRTLRYGSASGATPFGVPSDENAKDDYYRIKFGAQPVVLKRGDEYTPYKPDRPGSAWQGFMDFLSMTICLSSGFPPSVVLPVNIGGTDIRRDLDIAQRAADPIQTDIAAELDEIVDYFIEGEIQDGSLRAGLPSDWRNRIWHFPQKINVDRNQALQDREDQARGLMSLDEYHGRSGQDAEEVEVAVVAEAKRRREMISKAGFASVQEYLQVLSLNPQAMQIQQPQKESVMK